MNEKKGYRAVFLVLVLFLAWGCASVKPGAGLSGRYFHLLKEVRDVVPVVSVPPGRDGDDGDVPEGIETLDMERAVEMALRGNPGLHSMRERVKEAMEKYPQAISLDDPSFGIGLYPATIGSDRQGFSYRLDLSQRFPWPGKLALRGEIALRDAEAVMGDLNTVRLELIRMVKVAYIELLYIHRAIEINREEKGILQEFKSIATSMYAQGEGNLQDPTQAEVELARIEHRGVVLERMLRVAEARLNTLMGRPAGLPLPVPAGLPDIVEELPDRDLLVERALLSNPAIRAIRLKGESARAQLKLAELQYYPDFTITGSYNRAWMDEDLRPFAGIGITIPIWFGRLDAQKREAMARVRRLEFELRAIVDQVRYEVEEAYQRLEESIHAVRLFRERLLPSAELNLKAALAGYRTGRCDFLTLLTAERALIDTRLNYERTLTYMHIWKAELSNAIGEEP